MEGLDCRLEVSISHAGLSAFTLQGLCSTALSCASPTTPLPPIPPQPQLQLQGELSGEGRRALWGFHLWIPGPPLPSLLEALLSSSSLPLSFSQPLLSQSLGLGCLLGWDSSGLGASKAKPGEAAGRLLATEGGSAVFVGSSVNLP